MKLLLLFAILLLQCKKVGDSKPSSSVSTDNALRVTATYIGDEKCVEYYEYEDQPEPFLEMAVGVIADNHDAVKDIATHMLDGENGELISAERRKRVDNLQFSGDRFFARERKTLTLEGIESSCRRLVLSVDSDTLPTVEFKAGRARTKQRERFTKIKLDRFGKLDCSGNTPFCTFSNVKEGKRYFVLVEPDNTKKKIRTAVTYHRDGKKLIHTITIPNISCPSCQNAQ